MDFENITDMAYQKVELPKSATILEQLIWYKMLIIYQDYQKGIINLNQSIKRKEKLKSFYIMQKRLDDFYKDLHDERYKNIRQSEEMLKEILLKEQEKIPEKELTKMLIDYIVKITGRVPIKTTYDKNYEVN